MTAEAVLGGKANFHGAVRESETRQRLLIENWTQPVWEIDADGVGSVDTPSWRECTKMGGLAMVGVDIVPYYRRGALAQMVPLLRGSKPSELAWIGPQQVDVRLKGATAKRFSVAVPDGVPAD